MVLIKRLLNQMNINKEVSGVLSYIILGIAILLLCVLVLAITQKLILRIIAGLIKRNKYVWDDIMLENRVFSRITNLLPGIILYVTAPMFETTMIIELIKRGAVIYILVVTIFIADAFINTINEIYTTYPISKIRPIKGLLQVVKIIFDIIIIIVIIGALMNQNPLLMLGGIGAVAAVFSFVFKDSILGFIAGIQLTSNDMLRIGDWIEMPKYGADGDVIDITLNTVKVQNFDKTIVTLPAYSLVSDSFKNWRGMKQFGGRRIKRSIYIDMNSITFCTLEMLEKYKKINYLKEYVLEKEKELKQENQQQSAQYKLRINGRYLTNIGTFRIYIQSYLKNTNGLMKDMPIFVRQLEPKENGLPLEIYAFTEFTDWEAYETIQADIFDHILSIAEEFDLRLFQNPTGYDMRNSGI